LAPDDSYGAPPGHHHFRDRQSYGRHHSLQEDAAEWVPKEYQEKGQLFLPSALLINYVAKVTVTVILKFLNLGALDFAVFLWIFIEIVSYSAWISFAHAEMIQTVYFFKCLRRKFDLQVN
jgi:hypothetical protein